MHCGNLCMIFHPLYKPCYNSLLSLCAMVTFQIFYKYDLVLSVSSFCRFYETQNYEYGVHLLNCKFWHNTSKTNTVTKQGVLSVNIAVINISVPNDQYFCTHYGDKTLWCFMFYLFYETFDTDKAVSLWWLAVLLLSLDSVDPECLYNMLYASLVTCSDQVMDICPTGLP